MEKIIKITKHIVDEWNLLSILAICMSFTSMVQIVNCVFAFIVTGFAYCISMKTKKQGRKLSILAAIITLVSTVLCVQNGLWNIISVPYIFMSVLIALLAFIIVIFLMFFVRMIKGGDASQNMERADWVTKSGKLLFTILPPGWSKTRMIVVDSKDGTPYYVEQTKGTFGDNYFYTAVPVEWKEVRRFAMESPDKRISSRFAAVDRDNWFQFTKN